MEKNINDQEIDIVFAKFLTYMQIALYHQRINYYKNQKDISDNEISFEIIGDIFNETEKTDYSFNDILSEKEETTLYLHFSKNLSYKEISKISKEKASTIRQRGHRAIEKLRKAGYHNEC